VRRDAKLKRADDFFRELIAKSPIEEAAEQAEKAKKRMADIRNQEGAAFDSLNREGIQYLEKKTEVADKLKLADQATTTLQQDRAALIQKRKEMESQMSEWAEKLGERMTVLERSWLHIEEIDVAPAAPAAPKPAAPAAASAAPAAAPTQPAKPEIFEQLGTFLHDLEKKPNAEILNTLQQNADSIKNILSNMNDPQLVAIFDHVMSLKIPASEKLKEFFAQVEDRLLELAGQNNQLAASFLEAFRKGTA